MNWHAIRIDILQLVTTFTIALIAGWLFLQINMPAPYMMGSLFGVWIAGGNLPRLQPYLGVARWFHKPVVLGLGVLIGATFNTEFLSQVGKWQITVLTMIITTILVTSLGYVFLTKFRNYDRGLAFLCSAPGGQAEIVILAKDITDKDYVVALFHLVRVVVVFVSTPLLMAAIQGSDAVFQSNVTLQAMPSLLGLETYQIMMFVTLAITGFVCATFIRLPMPHLLGPLLFSTLFHLMGWIDLPRVNEFVILAQLTIGGGIGARLSKVPFKELFGYLKDALANTTLIISAYILSALLIAKITATSFLSVWLAFVPGGLYEVTLLAVIFGFDVAFVALHHLIRIILVIASIPLIAMRLQPNKSG